MMTDPISDMLTRIRNAYMVNSATVDVPLSKVKYAIAKILESEGYIESVENAKDAFKPTLRLTLRYPDGKTPALTSVKRVSTPGRRVYVKSQEIPAVRSGYGMSIISTPNGMMTSLEAKKRKLGGEVICELF